MVVRNVTFTNAASVLHQIHNSKILATGLMMLRLSWCSPIPTGWAIRSSLASYSQKDQLIYDHRPARKPPVSAKPRLLSPICCSPCSGHWLCIELLILWCRCSPTKVYLHILLYKFLPTIWLTTVEAKCSF